MPALHGLVPPKTQKTDKASRMPRKDQSMKNSLPISVGTEEELKEESVSDH